MGVAPGGVHDQTALVATDGLGKGLRALAVDDLLPSLRAGLGDVERGSGLVDHDGHDDGGLELRLPNLALDAAAVDGNVTEVGQQLLGTVLAANEGEELGGVVDEGGPAAAADKGWVRQQRSQEGNVGLDTPDAELDESAEHLASHNLVGGAVACALDQHGVVKGADDGTSEAVASVETDTIAASGTVDFDLASVGGETLCGVLGGDTALNRESTGGDAILRQAKLLERSTSRNLDLGSNDINASDLFGDSVLDLDAGVDLDEVVAVLLVDEELGGTSIAVANRLGQLHSIGQDAVTDIEGKVLGGSNLNDLLVTALNAAVTLIQMHNIAMVITKQLDLDVLGFIKEAFHKDGAVSKGGLGLGSSPIKRVREGLLVPNNTHTTATTTKGSLDDDWEAILIRKGLDLLEALNRARGTGNDGHSALDSQLAGRDLVTKSLNGVRGRTDKD